MHALLSFYLFPFVYFRSLKSFLLLDLECFFLSFRVNPSLNIFFHFIIFSPLSCQHACLFLFGSVFALCLSPVFAEFFSVFKFFGHFLFAPVLNSMCPMTHKEYVFAYYCATVEQFIMSAWSIFLQRFSFIALFRCRSLVQFFFRRYRGQLLAVRGAILFFPEEKIINLYAHDKFISSTD